MKYVITMSRNVRRSHFVIILSVHYQVCCYRVIDHLGNTYILNPSKRNIVPCKNISYCLIMYLVMHEKFYILKDNPDKISSWDFFLIEKGKKG